MALDSYRFTPDSLHVPSIYFTYSYTAPFVQVQMPWHAYRIALARRSAHSLALVFRISATMRLQKVRGEHVKRQDDDWLTRRVPILLQRSV